MEEPGVLEDWAVEEIRTPDASDVADEGDGAEVCGTYGGGVEMLRDELDEVKTPDFSDVALEVGVVREDGVKLVRLPEDDGGSEELPGEDDPGADPVDVTKVDGIDLDFVP